MTLPEYQPIDGGVDGHRDSDFWERYASMRRSAATRLVVTLAMLSVAIFVIVGVSLSLPRSSSRRGAWVQQEASPHFEFKDMREVGQLEAPPPFDTSESTLPHIVSDEPYPVVFPAAMSGEPVFAAGRHAAGRLYSSPYADSYVGLFMPTHKCDARFHCRVMLIVQVKLNGTIMVSAGYRVFQTPADVKAVGARLPKSTTDAIISTSDSEVQEQASKLYYAFLSAYPHVPFCGVSIPDIAAAIKYSTHEVANCKSTKSRLCYKFLITASCT